MKDVENVFLPNNGKCKLICMRYDLNHCFLAAGPIQGDTPAHTSGRCRCSHGGAEQRVFSR